MRVIPLLLLSLVALCIFVFAFTIIKLLTGQSIDQIMIPLADLWQVGKPCPWGLTAIIGAPIMLSTFWRNRDKVKKLIGMQKKS